MATSSERGARALRTPMGLGWARHLGLRADAAAVRCRAESDGEGLLRELEALEGSLRDNDPLVILELQHLGPEAAGIVAERVTEVVARRSVVLCSAGGLPRPLIGLAGEAETTTPVDLARFAALHPEGDRYLDGWLDCGGWPEAGRWDPDQGWGPSESLGRFATSIADRSPDLARLVLLCAVADQGLSSEVLASVMDADLAEVLSLAGEGEELGLLTWQGAMLHPGLPLLAQAISANASSRRAAAASLATDELARRNGFAAVPAVRTGLELDDDLRAAALGALARAEGSIDTQRWRSLARVYSGHVDPRIRRAGEDAYRRLLITRGASPSATRGEDRHDRSPAVELLRRVMNFDGVSLSHIARLSVDPVSALPVGGPGEGCASTIVEGVVAAMRGQDQLAESCMAQLLEGSSPVVGAAWHIAFLQGDWAAIDRIEADYPDSPYLSVAGAIRDAAEGRFVPAAAKFDALLGQDWTQAPPLLQHLALYIASGTDVELTRELLRHTRAPGPARIGSLPASYLRARAELVTGNPERARTRVVEVWEAAVSNGFTRPLRTVGAELMLIAAQSGGLADLCTAPPDDDLEPLYRMIHLLEQEKLDVDAARAAAASFPLLMGRTHADLMIARRAMTLGDRASAEELLLVVEATYAALGAPVDAARARLLLRRIDPSLDRGRHREFSERARAQGVTGREQEVLELVAKGLTNKEIAATLHLSVATVKRHVTSLLRRFDAGSRRELIGALPEVAQR